MSNPPVLLRPYRADDEASAIELWRRTWAASYPDIDFDARVAWWRNRWREELVPTATIVVAEIDGNVAGFVTVDLSNGYLDQIVVAPEAWGRGIAEALLDEAKHLSPAKLELHVNQDNARAIGFYAKHGFATVGEEVNPLSGRPIYRLNWSE
ncbi:MAG TPA: GNAT family N-acetyltransferase [Xanthobacteraceae bacterium]|jgi:putative acetyltransferase|nr:GNAT family N-acetyltransferase [Xanthobacteraceae bacterium]